MTNTPTIEELKAKVAQADALAEMKSNFLATMSHEIRTPMQTIYGLLELIGDEEINDNTSAMVSTAQDAAAGLLEILDDVLDLAKMDANKMELDLFEVPMRLLVRGILEALSVKVHGKNIALVDEISQDVPFVVKGDPKRLRQIIMNLCGNALKFTEKGTVTARVTTQVQHITPKEGQVGLRFEISDTGIGMSKEVCDRLFGAFTQADSSTSRKFGGTGLGLSISKKLVELMSGKIGVYSTEGHGSTFWFEIPSEEVSTDGSSVDLPDLDGISVISVEDHPMGGKEIVNSLRSMGAHVELCPTYKEGLELIKRRPFDVAIIDQGLPDGLGIDLIKEAMNIRPAMGLIMYTVRDDLGLQHSLQTLGVKYLTKPASRAGLGETVYDSASKASRHIVDGPRKMLIAEDTESVRYVLGQQLDKLGIEADFAFNGAQAFEAYKTGEYGIVITDLHMPELDGYGLVEKIRAEDSEGRHFPVIVLTADVQMAQRQVYLSHGFDECLLKPVSLGEFRGLLIRWGLMGEDDFAAPPPGKTQPSSPTSDKPSVDIEMIKTQMGALDETSIKMMHMFIDMTIPMVEKIKAALEAHDAHALSEAGHSLKGAARSACCPILGDLGSELQDSAADGTLDANLVTAIEEEFERVKEAIKGL